MASARRPRVRAAVAACTALCAVLIFPAAFAQQEAGLAEDLLALTNLDRTSNGLPALSLDRRLPALARERSLDMLTREYFSHAIPPDGTTVFDLMRERGIAFRAAGENLEQNTAPLGRSVRYARNEFMNSPSHRALILSPDMDHTGAGVAVGPDRVVYTVLFLGLDASDATPDRPAHPELRPELVEGPVEGPEPVENAEPARGQPTAGLGGAATQRRTAASPAVPQPALPPAEAPLGRLRQASGPPLGLIEELVNRTLHLYLGL